MLENYDEQSSPKKEKYTNAVLDTIFGQALATQGIMSQ